MKTSWKFIANVSLSIVFLIFFIFLISKLDLETSKELIKNIPFLTMALFVLFMFFSFLLKSKRFHILNTKLSFSKILKITMDHNFFLTFLPFRLGEVVYIRQLKKKGIGLKKSFSDLVLIRLFDVFVLAQFALVSILITFNGAFAKKIAFIIILVIIFLFFLLFLDKLFSKIVKEFSKLFSGKGQHFFNKLDRLSKYFPNYNMSQRIALLFISYLVWIFSFIPYVILLISLTNLSIFSILIVCIFALISSFIPINPPAGAGVVEAGWIFGFLFIGFSGDYPVLLSLTMHSAQLISLILIYIIFHIYYFGRHHLYRHLEDH
ncbi:MAG: flippase-like domain-containing protein [Nanoarchaeota archaeon]|nr:flippase-like domain-containing protein [Nanoarchaeota archaeon]